MEVPIDALNSLVGTYIDQISRADIWSLAGLYAAELSTAVGGGGNGNTNGNGFAFPFTFTGRVDCDAEPGAFCKNVNDEEVACGPKSDKNFLFPSADFTTTQLLTYMEDTFDFDDQETVAILGAHTLGVAPRENSGFSGEAGWVNNKLLLSNAYYDGIVGGEDNPGQAPNWNIFEVDNSDLVEMPDRFLWFRVPPVGGGGGQPGGGGGGGGGGNNRDLQQVIVDGNAPGNGEFMLNVDIALVRDFSDDITDGDVTCDFDIRDQNPCPFAETIFQASEYRDSNDLWLNDFRDAFTKMSQTGYDVDEIIPPATLPVGEPATKPILCFSGRNTVQLASGETIPIHDLNVGNKVLVHGGSYETVYSFGHRNPTATAEFVRLVTKSATLELSVDHMLLVSDRFAPASMVLVGDYLSNGDIVSSIKMVIRRGVYAPFTTTGTIVVSGISSSSYIALQKKSSKLAFGSVQTPFTWQWLSHTFEMPHRLFASLGETYTNEGISRWMDLPKQAMTWLLDQNVAIQVLVLVPALSVLMALSLFGQPWLGVLLVASSVILMRTARARKTT